MRRAARSVSRGRPAGYWRKRLELMDALVRSATASSTSLAQSSTAISAKPRSAASCRVHGRHHIGACVFLGVDPMLWRRFAIIRVIRRRSSGWGWARSDGFSSAYSVDIIGTGTPALAARRTIDPAALRPRSAFPAIDQSAMTTASSRGIADIAADPFDHVCPVPARLPPAATARLHGSLRETAPGFPNRPTTVRSAAVTRR